MYLNDEDRALMGQRDSLSAKEVETIDTVFKYLYATASFMQVAAAKDDRAAKLEAAMIRFIQDSRE